MSLNREETRRTAEELRANLALSGLTDDEVRSDLGWPTARFDAVVTLADTADPADVWLLRDYLQAAVREAGNEPRPFSVLTERSRTDAEGWFGLRVAPRHRFGPSAS